MAEVKKIAYKSKVVRVKDSLVNQEVDFSDVEAFKFNAPKVTEGNNTLVITSNADALKQKIQSIVDRYKGTELTSDNVDYVKTLKSNFVSLRTGIERERKEWNKVYLDPMKKTVDAVCKELQSIVAEGENALTEQLDAYDQKRKDALNQVLNGYREEAIKKYNLREEYASLLVLKDKYYNKTQDEEDTIDDIEEQAKELSKQQSEYDSSVALIEAECKGTMLISKIYIEQLKYRSCMEILLKIKNDKIESQKLYEEAREKERKGEAITVGKPIEEFTEKLDNSDELRVRKIQITYKATQAEEVKKLFDRLKSMGISYSIIKD